MSNSSDSSEPNLKKWQVTEVADPIPKTILKHTSITPLLSNENNTLIKYDRTWLNNELRFQHQVLESTPDIIYKIQLYKELPYTKKKFEYWMSLNGNNPSTQELYKKIDEILEARLVTSGLTVKNWPFIIFLLKNAYDYQDNRTVTNDTSVTFNVTRGAISSVPTKRKQVKAN